MNIKRVIIDTLPPEVGPDGKRLIVLMQDGRYVSILIDLPLTTQMLAKGLESLARELRKI